MTFKFFTFDESKTPDLSLRDNETNHGTVKLEPGSQYFLEKETHHRNMNENQMKEDINVFQTIFEVDPSRSGVQNEHIELANYLDSRSLTIDVWDADSLLHYGTCKFPLNELLRQQKSVVVKAKQCDILEPAEGRYVGALQIVISNKGLVPSVFTNDPLR
jgi:hypothetical protein